MKKQAINALDDYFVEKKIDASVLQIKIVEYLKYMRSLYQKYNIGGGNVVIGNNSIVRGNFNNL